MEGEKYFGESMVAYQEQKGKIAIGYYFLEMIFTHEAVLRKEDSL